MQTIHHLLRHKFRLPRWWLADGLLTLVVLPRQRLTAVLWQAQDSAGGRLSTGGRYCPYLAHITLEMMRNCNPHVLLCQRPDMYSSTPVMSDNMTNMRGYTCMHA